MGPQSAAAIQPQHHIFMLGEAIGHHLHHIPHSLQPGNEGARSSFGKTPHLRPYFFPGVALYIRSTAFYEKGSKVEGKSL